MNSKGRSAALLAGFAVLALVAASVAWAGPAQKSQRAEEEADFLFAPAFASTFKMLPFALAFAQDQDDVRRTFIQEIRPTFRLPGTTMWRSSSLASRVLANADEIELTAQQEQAIRNAQRAHRREKIRRDADMEIAELEIEEMMEDDLVDLDAVEQKLRQVANLQVDDRMAEMRLERNVRGILTAEQLDELRELDPVRVIFRSYRDPGRWR